MGGFEALLVSTLTVALAEIGDKTQLLALVLAAKYRKPWPIIAGILAATLVNHAASAWVGAWLSAMVPPNPLPVGKKSRRLRVTWMPTEPSENTSLKRAFGVNRSRPA